MNDSNAKIQPFGGKLCFVTEGHSCVRKRVVDKLHMHCVVDVLHLTQKTILIYWFLFIRLQCYGTIHIY